MTPLLLAAVLAAPPKPDPSADLFTPAGPVPKFQITVEAGNLKQLRQDPRAYVRATVRVGDQTFKDVGIHLKGAAGSWRDWNDKPGLTLNFDKFVEDQSYRGLDKIHLNNGVQDGSYLQEILANEMYLAAGVPACRCTHATVELNGRKVGLYVFKEGFDRSWLRRHFDNPNGNLYDGGFLTDINGQLKLDAGKDNGRKDLRALVRACSEGDANKRYAAVGKLVDVDRFLSSAAVQIVTADWDGYIRKPNNYRVYFDPKGKAVVIPHGLDQMWQNPGEELWHGWGGMIARAILDHPEGKKKAIARLKEVVEKHFVLKSLTKRIDELAPRAKAAIESVHGKGSGAGYENEVKWLKERLKQRDELLRRELPKLK
jgi:spore coat protein CotH